MDEEKYQRIDAAYHQLKDRLYFEENLEALFGEDYTRYLQARREKEQQRAQALSVLRAAYEQVLP